MSEENTHQIGFKDDKAKPRPSLVLHGFANAIDAVIEVAEFGAAKYTADGWAHVPNGVERYTDALYRHQIRRAKGDYLDGETNLRESAHIAWNALAVLELELRKAAEKRAWLEAGGVGIKGVEGAKE